MFGPLIPQTYLDILANHYAQNRKCMWSHLIYHLWWWSLHASANIIQLKISQCKTFLHRWNIEISQSNPPPKCSQNLEFTAIRKYRNSLCYATILYCWYVLKDSHRQKPYTLVNQLLYGFFYTKATLSHVHITPIWYLYHLYAIATITLYGYMNNLALSFLPSFSQSSVCPKTHIGNNTLIYAITL